MCLQAAVTGKWFIMDMAKDINPKASRRELDMLLTTGEQTSVALMAIAVTRKIGLRITSAIAEMTISSSRFTNRYSG